jgi:MoxR-like ATPase
MQKLNLKALQGLLPVYFENKIPLYLWGKPSTGKTAIIRQFAMAKAEELGLKYSEDEFGSEYFTLKVIPLSQFDAPDLRGMPELQGEGVNRITTFIPSKELPRTGQGIIFFDELNLADDTVK